MPYHNAVFIGYDEKGIPRYAALRGTASKFKGEVTGSDKQYSFNIPAAKESTTVHLFEAAIDLLSYATMEYRAGRDWHKDHLLSLAGVFITKREDVVPVALERYLRYTQRSIPSFSTWTGMPLAEVPHRALSTDLASSTPSMTNYPNTATI